MIKQIEVQGLIHGCRVSCQTPSVSHFLFADDNLFFIRASDEECRQMLNILTEYDSASEQSINFNKSCIFFSNNVLADIKEQNCLVLGVSNLVDTSYYLGLPSLIGRNKHAIFIFVRD